jgi:DNA-binding NtrC family response regulator
VKDAILCVDDETIILLSLKQELRREFGTEFTYETARSGDEALDIVEEIKREGQNLALVISDWLMPGLAGDELIVRIKGRSPETKAIIVTGHANEKRISELQKDKFICGVVRKPWSHGALVKTVRACLSPVGEP